MAGALYLTGPVTSFAQKSKQSRVVLIRNNDLLDDLNKPRKEIVGQMLDEAVRKLLDEKDAVKAWKSIVKPADVVGIKSNEWQPLCTPPELESAIKQRLKDAGVPEANIGIIAKIVISVKNFTEISGGASRVRSRAGPPLAFRGSGRASPP